MPVNFDNIRNDDRRSFSGEKKTKNDQHKGGSPSDNITKTWCPGLMTGTAELH